MHKCYKIYSKICFFVGGGVNLHLDSCLTLNAKQRTGNR